MERCMLGITRCDRKRNTWVRNITRVTDIIERVMKLRWSWAGHVARQTDQRWTKELLEWYPRDHTRARGRPKGRWMDEIRRMCGTNWMNVAQDREKWKTLREPFVQKWISSGA